MVKLRSGCMSELVVKIKVGGMVVIDYGFAINGKEEMEYEIYVNDDK